MIIFSILLIIGISFLIWFVQTSNEQTPREVTTTIRYYVEGEGIVHKYDGWADDIKLEELESKMADKVSDLQWDRYTIKEVYRDNKGRIAYSTERVYYNEENERNGQ